MKLGKGIHRKTPVWIWLIMIACSVMVLPGAALIFAQEEDSAPPKVETQTAETEDQTIEESVEGQTLPSPYYLRDDIQYFPKGPEFKLRRADELFDQPLSQEELDRLPKQEISKYDSSKEEWIAKEFNVKEILDVIRREKLETRSAEERLILELPCRYPGTKEGRITSSTPEQKTFEVRITKTAGLFKSSGLVLLGGPKPTIRIIGVSLWVYDTPTVVDHVEKILKQIEEAPLNMIVVESRFLTVPRGMLDELELDWSVGHSGPSQLSDVKYGADPTQHATWLTDRPNRVLFAGETVEFEDELAAESPVQGASYVEKTSPVLYSLVDNDYISEIAIKSRSTSGVNILQAPTMTMFSGQDGEIMDGSTRPFVVGLKRVKDPEDESKEVLQPVIRLFQDGTRLKLNATLKEDRSIDLNCQVKFSQILSVETADVPLNQPNIKIHIPEVESNSIRSSLNIPEGKTLALGSIRENKDGDKVAFMVLLTCRSILTESPNCFKTVEQVSVERIGEILGGKSGGKGGMPTSVMVLNADGNFVFDEVYTAQQQAEILRRNQPRKEPKASNGTENENEVGSEKLLLKSKRPATADSPTEMPPELVAVFERLGVSVRTIGHFDYTLTDEFVQVDASEFSFSIDSDDPESESEFLLEAETGYLRFSRREDSFPIKGQLSGKVKFNFADMSSAADDLRFEINETEVIPNVKLRGNASMAFEGGDCKLTADSIALGMAPSPEILILEGNGSLVREKQKTNIRAERIVWNTDTDSIDAEGFDSGEIR